MTANRKRGRRSRPVVGDAGPADREACARRQAEVRMDAGQASPAGLSPVWSAGPDGRDEVGDEAASLIERAHEALFEGRVAEAEYLMRQALEHGHFSAVYNNLALLELEHHHRPDKALRLLRKNLDSPHIRWQPFTRAVASRCLLRMDRRDEARQSLRQAIRDFEAGFCSEINRMPWARQAWAEYISKILEAAGELGDHGLAWNLYRRWKRHVVLNSSHALGGIAAFNLGLFRAAAEAWRLAQDDARPYLRVYAAVATWCDRGLIEPFRLDYELGGPDPLHELVPFLMGLRVPAPAPVYADGDGRPTIVALSFFDDAPDARCRDEAPVACDTADGAPDGGAFRDVDEDVCFSEEDPAFVLSEEARAAEHAAYLIRFAAAMQRPANRMLLTWLAFRTFFEHGSLRDKRSVFLRGVRELIAAGGRWGEATARRLFAASEIGLDLKEAAAQGLLDAGRLSRDATVRMWWNGHMRDVPFKSGELRVPET